MSLRLIMLAVFLLVGVAIGPLPVASADSNTSQNPSPLNNQPDPLTQGVDCVCGGTFQVGERVKSTVDGPDGNFDIHIGSLGTVVCGTTLSPPLLISWDGLTSGHNGNGFCVCPVSSAPDSTGWYVNCSDVVGTSSTRAEAPVISWNGTVALGVALAAIGIAASHRRMRATRS